MDVDNRGETAPTPGATIDVPGQAAESRLGTGGAPTHLPYGLSLSASMVALRTDRTLEFQAFDHLALRVADVRRAEAFYHDVFQMDIVQRSRRAVGHWENLPNDFDWDHGLRTGYYPDVIVLRNGPITLVLENAGRGAVMVEPRLGHVGLWVTSETLAALRAVALMRSFAVSQDEPHAFRFIDPFGITWHLTDAGA